MLNRHVFTQHQTVQRRQGTPVLVDRGEPPLRGRKGRPATGSVSGRAGGPGDPETGCHGQGEGRLSGSEGSQINDSQKESWCRVLEDFDETQGQSRQMALFPWDRQIPVHALDIGIGVRLKDFSLHRPRQMLDVHFPPIDGRTLILSRYTQPEPDQKILLEKLNLQPPDQPPPRITSANQLLT
jgi:hypothetical protein